MFASSRQSRLQPSLPAASHIWFTGWDWAGMSMLIVLVSCMQWSLAFLGLHYDDYLVYRHYALFDVVRSFWTNIAVVTSEELWISAYRPMTLVAHAITYELFGFNPNQLLVARILLQSATGILFAMWLRMLGQGAVPAWFGAVAFVFFPLNFHVFRWSTEIGAITGLVWFLLSLIFQTRNLFCKSNRVSRASLAFWALALLTKEVVVPVVIVFAILELLYSEQRSMREIVRRTVPYFAILICYLLLRSFVLQGKWGGQGISPDTNTLSQFMVSAAKNYWLFVQNILLADTVSLLHPKSSLPAFLVSTPIAVVFFISIVGVHDFYLKARLEPLFRRQFLDEIAGLSCEAKSAILGFSLLICGGLICCFYPADRVMYISTLGCALIYAGLVQSLLSRFRMSLSCIGTTVVLFLSAAHLASGQFLFYQRATAPSSPFVKSAEMHDLQAYFVLGHLFERWEAFDQARTLRSKLVTRNLIDSQGTPNKTEIYACLLIRGYSQQEADSFVASLDDRKGACELRQMEGPNPAL